MGQEKRSFRRFLKDWMLVISIVSGIILYIVYHNFPSLHPAGPALLSFVKTLQPILLFAMLFISFCKISPKDLKPHKWQICTILVQAVCFCVPGVILIWAMGHDGAVAHAITSARIPLETVMLCMICPTATACAVVTSKLGGNMAQVVTYTIFINLLTSVLVPLFLPLIYPQEGMDFMTSFLKILGKVFPLLIMPCLAAWLFRWLLPSVHRWLCSITDLAFYIWAVSLMFAILMSTRAIMQHSGDLTVLLWIATVSLACCAFQFWTGRRIGRRFSREIEITSGQALGQKNTVFSIWLGYTFMDPIVSVAGGFYSIWHNVYNSHQLRVHGASQLKRP